MTTPQFRRHVHVSGVGGVGMNGVAQLLLREGYRVTGSDRFRDEGRTLPVLHCLQKLGVELVPQDGAVLTAETESLVISTAVETDNPERVAADRLGIKEVHRADVLASCAHRGSLAAVAGTSGKTTCTGWLAWVLDQCGFHPNMVNGGGVLGWKTEDAPGNVRWCAPENWWVVEVDESDRSLLKFHPEVALINTLSEDHHSWEETVELFRAFARQVTRAIICGPGVKAHLEGDGLIQARLIEGGGEIPVPMLGAHNRQNAAVVRAMALACGAPEAAVDRVLSAFPGVERRLQRWSRPDQPAVIDDYAHNPEKIAAAMAAVRTSGRRLVLWRPHGFAPLQNNFQGFVEAFTQELDSRDEAWILPVFYAGGTAPRGICSGDLVEALCAKGVKARLLDRYPPRVWLGKEDVLLIMGARDPDLPVFAARMGSSLRPHSNGFEGTPGDLRTCAFPAR